MRTLVVVMAITGALSLAARGIAPGETPAREEPTGKKYLAQDSDFPSNPTRAEQIAMLRTESLEQSLYRLKNINMFFSPGPVEPGDASIEPRREWPLPDELELYSVDVIMGNRRVLKLHRDLAALPHDVAANLVSRRLQDALAAYRAAYAADEQIHNPHGFTRESAERARSTPGGSLTGVGFISRTPDPNEVTLSGLRYAVLSLVWLAGALELEGVRDAIIEVSEEAVSQRNTLYEDQTHHDLYKASILKYLSLYSRTILGTALLRLSPEGLESQEIAAERRTFRQTAFDARQTATDRAGPPDFSRGEITVEYFVGITDAVFDDILWRAKSP